MAKQETKLSQELVAALQGETIVSLITNDPEKKQPDLSVISWVAATEDGEKIKFAVGHNAHSAQNIQADPNVVLGITGAGSCYSVRGKGTVSDVIEKTMKFRVVTVDIESVEDVIFYGGKITAEPQFEKTYDPKLAAQLDEEVYSMLKE
ncbi:pyridoxamine 5'-phosphate oxidase family protein [Evansella cellulosilytica]|uniref:Pyridoxamine 5'-phosphate oxidase-related FMN-binding protein n=1 Tax=Evansella cellulosilytica (strain ATCC 21833 / DSM 2522 / FERM P-1141 / JCM 9156 / N-4) TaxID=649639 RepID=E6U0U3_EVAC2|nr:pyridoxamine 5'-phosphate oxidase family protein [Evansella cellulosilytica]ADU29141.1 pyridoxamine 5'-phosphate oxidase-related FMN-binding protein [Evansella cellulosilytica DSM 2522]